jgi:hypothetical protein
MALANSPTPHDEEHVVILQAAKAAVDTQIPELFDGAIDALWSVASQDDLPTILALLDKCREPRRAASLLSVGAKFDNTALAQHAQVLRAALLRFTQPWHEGKPLTDRLATLAAKLSGIELLDEMPQTDTLNVGRGKLWTAALASYGGVDEHVAQAYVKFAREASNVGPQSPSVEGLASCVGAGFGDLIATQLAEQNAEGHKQIVSSPLLDQVFGSLENVVVALANGLSRVHENHRQASAVNCAAGILMCRLYKQDHNRFELSSTRWISQRWQDRQSQQTAKKIAEALGGDTEGTNPLDVIARLVRDGQHRIGALALLNAMLFPFDDLSVVALKALLQAAAAIDFPASDGLQLTSGLVDFFPMAEEQHVSPWLRRALPEYFLVGGKLNRFAVVLWEKLNPQFPSGLDNTLGAISSVSDADFLLEMTRKTPKAEALKVLSRGVSFHANDGKLTHHVRERSIGLLVEAQRKANFDAALLAPCLTVILDRFADVQGVRCVAYEACGELADLKSIQPLRTRLGTENTAKGKATIRAALGAIRERLLREKPPADNVGKTIEWLNHVVELADPATLEDVSCFLSPAHPHGAVQTAAVKALGAIGNKKGLEVLRRFVDDTAPSGDLLAATRRSRIALEVRGDAELFDELRKMFGEESELVDPAIDYSSAVGQELLRPLTQSLSEASKRRQVGHWDDLVTRLDGIAELLVRALYRRKFADFGLAKDKAEPLSKGNYANLINVSQFKDKYPKLHAQCDLLHTYRREAPAAHAANADGTEKAGVTEQDAENALTVFREVIRELMGILRR